MATIKAIEAKSVHQIQSGQVIVDLCSVVKELVENSLDAGATSIEVRFKNNGLDSIEVQDNGSGIAPANYDNIALKHFTSKLSSYDDLSSLQTFGFRGEALSSLCALSKFSMTTAQAADAPKGQRLDFDGMGKLKSTTTVACQKGTTAVVENLFDSLPVRRKELTKNIKREYGKVLGLLQAYACICVNVKFTVKNAMPKAKSMTVFSTKANASTRENIANVYGAKTLMALIPLDLDLEFQPTLTQMARKDRNNAKIHVKGHISKPVFGEGRQTPDRQMFFVNGRPCGLPQIAKAINEVYKSFNVSQSPFIFADLQMDTNAYDVNVSPDKRTILLHDSAALIENLKAALDEMFDQQDQTVPQSQLPSSKLPAFQKLTFQRQESSNPPDVERSGRLPPSQQFMHTEDDLESSDEADSPQSLTRQRLHAFASTRDETEIPDHVPAKLQEELMENVAERRSELGEESGTRDECDHSHGSVELKEEELSQPAHVSTHFKDLNESMTEQGPTSSIDDARSAATVREPDSETDSPIRPTSEEPAGVVKAAFDRMRPKRMPAELATVTIGDKTMTTVLGSQFPSFTKKAEKGGTQKERWQPTQSSAAALFSHRLRKFGAQNSSDQEDDEPELDIENAEPEQSEGEVDTSAPSQNLDDDPHDLSDGDANESVNDDVEFEENEDDRGSDESDAGYIDEAEKKKMEEARVAELIRAAEESSAVPSKENLKRAAKALSGGQNKDSTTHLMATTDFSTEAVAQEMRQLFSTNMKVQDSPLAEDGMSAQDPETRLSLTVAKGDFSRMKIVGQFNLGFILAVRPASPESHGQAPPQQDELFIIDQHASDEKYNFERLQAETVVGNQRLVRPVTLDLTAVEEEVVLENNEALEKNGFLVEIDTSGEKMVGQRCRLISLPLSKEVVFNTRDLEELIQLLAESPGFGSLSDDGIPRPSKVRKMFAMRACRSSIMIGKTLSKKQMETVVAHMGTIDKPWNCPHGRPTMRHLCSLNALEPWSEGDVDDDEVGERQLSLGEALRRYAADEEDEEE